MSDARFTIILPVYNGDDHLKECVRSILTQTHGDFELAVLENASTDGAREWLAALKESRVRVYPAEEHLSIKANRGRALALPEQEFMTFIGHDDLLDPNYLQVMERLIRQHPDASFSYLSLQAAFRRTRCLRLHRFINNSPSARRLYNTMVDARDGLRRVLRRLKR